MVQSATQQPSPVGGPELGVGTAPLSSDDDRAVLGETMGLVALTLGSLALGAYIGRDLDGWVGILFFVAGFGCVFGLHIASSRGREQLAITLLLGLGLLLGLALGPRGGLFVSRWSRGTIVRLVPSS